MKSKTTHETRSFNIASFSGISQHSLFSCRIQLHIYMIKSTDFCFFLHSCTFFSMIVFGYCAAVAIYCCYCYYCWCCSRSLLLFVVFMCPLFFGKNLILLYVCDFQFLIFRMQSHEQSQPNIHPYQRCLCYFAILLLFILVFIPTAKSISIASQAATLFDKTENRNKIKK